jgi:L-ribulokinase
MYSIGLDFGTASCRALVARIDDGAEVGTGMFAYRHGDQGVIGGRDPNFARQHPADYLEGITVSVRQALADACSNDEGFSADKVVGIGIDATASTPIPVDRCGVALALRQQFSDDLDAMAWLWKDHTSCSEAEQITQLVGERYPKVLERIGGAYTSEWFWAKIMRCGKVAPHVFDAAHTWVELQDWIPASLTGTTQPDVLKRGICAAGHKGLFSSEWGGYPPRDLLIELEAGLGRVRDSLPDQVFSIAQPAGTLTPDWAAALGLPQPAVVAIGGIDAHLGAVGAGVAPGAVVKIMGTSTCDIAVSPLSEGLPSIPGISGVVPESVLPGMVGLEAGQAAVGDLFDWWCRTTGRSHEALSSEAARLAPGECGLLALDWNNGNRSVLADPNLSGLLVGQTLRTTPGDVYRALIEATAFGARVILDRLREGGISIDEIIVCGGIAEKSPLILQIYADVLRVAMKVSRSAQTCALGAAMAGAVASGAIPSFEEAARRMTGTRGEAWQPNAQNSAVYSHLFDQYLSLHDAFGRPDGPYAYLMKHLRQQAATARS